MSQTLEERCITLANQHRDSGILLDTNVLLLFLFACFQPEMIGRKRLSRYEVDDGNLLAQYVQRFDRILTTPHVLTETSNLANQMADGQTRKQLMTFFYPLFCLNLPESLVRLEIEGASIDAKIFVQLGLTDAGLASLIQPNRLLLTDDLNLYVAAVSNGQDALNFTHMREATTLM